MEDILAVVVTVMPLTVGSIWFLGKTTLGQALARRIEGRGSANTDEVDALREDVQQLNEHVTQLRGENAEFVERLDFTERMLTRARSITPSPQTVISGEN